MQRQLHHPLDRLRRQRLATGRAAGVLQQALDPGRRIASPPAAHARHALADLPRYRHGAHTVTGQQHDPRPPHHLLWRVAVPHQFFQPFPIARGQLDAFDLAHDRKFASFAPLGNPLMKAEH